MKNVYLSLLAMAFVVAGQSQTSVDLGIGPGYVNQLWYSLDDDAETSAPKNEWDLAFHVNTYSSSIHINSASGVGLWTYPDGDISDWNETIDVSNIDSWIRNYNSDISWQSGAFDQNVEQGNNLDFGWGLYNPVNHFVIGDSLFVIQLPDLSYQKLKVTQLSLSGVYDFTYADLDGSNEVNVQISKADYAGKNFAYYSIQNGNALDREPLSNSWDLLFTQYVSFVPMAYAVTGVLHNGGIEVAQADDVDVEEEEAFGDFEFSEEINSIGYDWKSFNGQSFDIVQDRVYFLRQADGDIWKLVFTGFGGSATGGFQFTKEFISAAGIEELNAASLKGIYPNPAENDATILIQGTAYESANISITDNQGRTIESFNRNIQQGLNAITLPLEALPSGIYHVTLTTTTTLSTQKLVVR